MKKLLYLITICIFLSIFPSVAFAHVLETDHSIGAVVHINPSDEPVAGNPTTIIFEIKDRENKFSFEKCACIFSILQSKNQIVSQDITPTSDKNVAVIPYTFTESGEYVLKLQGKPKNSKSFHPFTLTYAIRVGKESNEALNNANNNFPIILSVSVGIVISIVFGAIIMQKKHFHSLKK